MNVPFTDDEKAIWELLQTHLGHESAIQIDALCARTGLSERQVKGAVSYLILRHKFRIGSCRNKKIGAGYFVIRTPEEIEQTVRPLRAQALTMLRRIAILEGKPARKVYREMLGQLEIDFEAA